MGVLRGLHVMGAIFMLGGISAQLLVRLQAGGVAGGSEPLLAVARRVQLAMVSAGSAVVLVTGIALWVTDRIKFLTGWLLLGVLLYLAAAALDGAFLVLGSRGGAGLALEPDLKILLLHFELGDRVLFHKVDDGLDVL